MNFEITDLFVYPIKSLPGIRLESARLTDKGIYLDRKWMLTHENGQFITQRTIPSLVLFKLEIKEDHLLITHPEAAGKIQIPFQIPIQKGRQVTTNVWGTDITAEALSPEINNWFSDIIGQRVYLVFIPEEEQRPGEKSSGCCRQLCR